MKNLFGLITVFLLLINLGCNTAKNAATYPKEVLEPREVQESLPKNIIFLIGDGMGMGQITAGTFANNNHTHLEDFPVVGLHKPYAYDNLITDSAAAATAFSCGKKTYNGAIGVDHDTIPCKTFLEEAVEEGMATGLVATSTIVHATPASYIAHNKYRKNYEDIADDFLLTPVDFLAGGGKKYFDRRDKDDRNLLEEMTSDGYTVIDYINDMPDVKMKMESADKFFYLSADDDPIPAAQGRDYLIEMGLSGINFLKRKSNNGGFFIMIEGSQIDWGGHANNSDYIISEFKEFDNLIGKVLTWAKQDGETLVVVTADHETGGYTIQPKSRMDSLVTAFTSTYHTGDFIPVFAYGPKSELFSGLYENTEIYHRMRKAMGWE